ncbi:MAG: M4 family metallopeptidase, partial [Chloroflexi bacterium]|nr:M4 family metallopeptidase [Chloroflexota bacterium]
MVRRRYLVGALLALTIVVLGLLWGTAGISGRTDPEVRTATHDQTGKLTFLGVDPASAITLPGPPQQGLEPPDRGLAFLNVYGRQFGLDNPGQELATMRAQQGADGRASVRYQQTHQGVPILAGELIVNTDSEGRLLSISGEISPDLSLSTTPILTAAEAASIARSGVAKWYGLDAVELETSEPELWIFDERLLRKSGRPQELVWRIDVSPKHLSSIKELVLVNAERGGVSLHFNQIDSALNRTVYDNNNTDAGLPGLGPVRTEGGPVHAVTDVNEAYDYAGDTYNFYMTNHGRDSLDDAGMELVSTVRFCNPAPAACPYANAFWNGIQMAYGAGFAVDDVVGHELTHGVTNFTSNLFYYYQSGAINESFSDIWGEFVDLGNGAGTDTAGVRWLIGEDLPGGAIRNMSNPPASRDPDKMTSAHYATFSSDNGGVHTNSGINNKAAYLLTDGGTFNGQTVTALGITKVAKIYYEVQTSLLTSGSDYGDLYTALFQGCLNLVGTSGISAADCQEVRDATDAVEMNLEPSAGFNPDAPMCPGGQGPIMLFFDDLESGDGNWDATAITGPNAWSLVIGFAHSGTVSLYANGGWLSSDSVMSMVADVALVPASSPYLWFAHAYEFESPDSDGGFFEYSTNSGGSWSDAGALIDDGKSYDGSISAGSDNPNGGHSAYLDRSHGYVSTR